MGRRSTDKKRKALTERSKVWLRDLLSKLQDKDLSKLTLDEHAAMIGKSKSTIYSYFSTKEEIYISLVHLVLDDIASLGSVEVEEEDMEAALKMVMIRISKGIEGISIDFLVRRSARRDRSNRQSTCCPSARRC